MINLTEGATGGGANDLNFVSLSRESPEGSMISQPTLATDGDNFDLLTKWSDAFLGVGDGMATGTKRKSVLETKFDVTSAQVAIELLEALSGGYRARVPLLAGLSSARNVAASAAAFGDSSDVLSIGSQFLGDWWGPTWLTVSLSFVLCLSRNIGRVAMSGPLAEVDLTCAIPALLTSVFYVGMMTIFLNVFCRSVVRDPTFFGSTVQRLKLYSIAGYSAAPLAVAVMLDALTLGVIGVCRSGFIHWMLVYGVASVASGLYLHARFPLAAIGAFGASFDPAKARGLFWLSYLVIGGLTATFIQLIFVV